MRANICQASASLRRVLRYFSNKTLRRECTSYAANIRGFDAAAEIVAIDLSLFAFPADHAAPSFLGHGFLQLVREDECGLVGYASDGKSASRRGMVELTRRGIYLRCEAPVPADRSLQIRDGLKAHQKAKPPPRAVGGGVQVDGARLEEVAG
jgi:hypothetical protein